VSTELPYISALLPSKNGERYLSRLIPRILLMLGENDELLVVNDGSTDNSSLILADLAKSDARLKIVTTVGVGLVTALNLGIAEAKNPWVARFDVDDEYPLNRINLQRKLIEDNIVAIFSDYSFTTSVGVSLGTLPSAITSNPTKLSLVSSQRTPHPVALLNRASVLSVGGYRVEDFPAEDLGLWFRLLERGRFLSVPKVLLSYRLSGSSISSSNRKEQFANKSKIIISFRSWDVLVQNCLEEFSSTISCYLRHQRSTARIILHLRDVAKAAKLSGIKFSMIQLLLTLPLLTLIKIPFVSIDILTKTMARRIYRLAKNFL
jgi:glycosyltransferase involved in cell wall biosynthesis